MADNSLLSDADVGIAPPAAPPSAASTNAPPIAFMSDDDVGIKPVAPPPSTGAVAGGLAKSVGSGLVRGVVGAPAAPASFAKTAADGILDLGEWGVRKALGWGPVSAQEQAKRDKAAQDIAAASPIPSALDVAAKAQTALDPYLHKPETTAEKYAEAGGEFLPLVATSPETLAGMGTVKGAASTLAGRVAAPAVASEAAGQATEGTPYEPYARAAAGILGDAAAHGVEGTAKVAGDAAAPMVAKGLASVGMPGMQQKLAGKQLLAGANDPAAFRQALNNPTDGTFQIVSGSEPTTFQATGDTGIGQMERGDRTANPAPYFDRSQQQNAARQQLLQSVTPIGSPEDVPTFLQSQFDKIDSDAQAHVDQAQATAQEKAGAIGTGQTPEATGAELRGHLDTANQVAKDREGELHEVIDPKNTLVASTGPLSDAVDKAYGNLSRTAQGFVSAPERKFIDLIQSYNPTESYREVADLSSNLAAEMRAERAANQGITPAYRRMAIMMSGVKDALHNTVQERVAAEAKAVAAGTLAPENTINARYNQFVDSYFERQQQARVAASARRADAAPGRGSSSGAGVERTERQVPGRSGDGSGDQGTSPPPGSRPDQPQVAGNIAYQAPDFGARTVSAQMHAPETTAALGQDVPGTVVRPYGGPLDARQPAGQSGIVAYHGSPYDFERFSSAHIGRGDGRQVQGSGINATSSKDLAETYAKSTTENNARSVNHGVLKVDGKFVQPDFEDPRYMAADALMRHGGDVSKAISNLRGGMRADIPEAQEGARMLEAGEVRSAEKPTPNVYQVRIAKRPATFLDWDKPFSEQTPFVQAAIKRAGIGPGEGENPLGSEIYAKGSREPEELADIHAENRGFSKRLSDAGISGVSYADSHKNYGGANAGSVYDDARNYVVFNDHDIHVTHKNGVPLAGQTTLPDYLRGEAQADFVKELTSAGMKPVSFSRDLRNRGFDLLKAGSHLDYGTAYGHAFFDGAPKEVQDAILGRTTSAGSGQAPGDGRIGAGPGQEGEAAGASVGRGSASPASGAPGQDGLFGPVSDEAAGRIRAANQATRERKDTFERGPVGEMLRPGPVAGTFKLSDYAMPAKALRNGPAGGATVRAYLKAAGNTPEALESLKGAAGESLRSYVNANGVLPPDKLAAWKNRLSHALKAIDEASPGFSKSFDDAGKATDALAQAGIARQQALKTYQTGAVGKLMHAGSEDEVINRLDAALKAPDRVTQMRRLVEQTKASPDAVAGLRKGVSESLARRFTSAIKSSMDGTETISPGTFTKLVRERQPALREVLGPEHLDALNLVAQDLDREVMSYEGSKMKGSPGTAADLHQAAKGGHGDAHGFAPKSFLGAVIGGAVVGHEVGDIHTAAWGAATGGGAYLVNRLRAAGVRDIQHLVSQALLDPALARQLVKKVGTSFERERRITGHLQGALIHGPDKDDGGVPPNQPPPTGPFSRGGGDGMLRNATTNEGENLNTPPDDRGRIEPTMSGSSSTSAEAKPDTPQPNVPLTARQARTLRSAGYEPDDIRAMTPQERAAALRKAEAAGHAPSGRITAADRAAMGGALPHVAFDNRTADGRFSGRGDILAHPDINGRIEPTWHPDADRVHQEILAHEKRLYGDRQPAPPPAIPRDTPLPAIAAMHSNPVLAGLARLLGG